MRLPATTHREPTQQKIIRAAIDLIADAGFANLTIARVASKAGVAYGNLTYHFPTREQLINALFDHWLSKWQSELIAKIKSIQEPAGRMSLALMHTLLQDALARQTSRLSTELRALSQYDSTLAKRIQNLMDEVVELAAEQLGAHPAHPKSVEIRSQIYFLLTLSQGVSTVWGGSSKTCTRGREIVDLACETIASKLDRCLKLST